MPWQLEQAAFAIFEKKLGELVSGNPSTIADDLLDELNAGGYTITLIDPAPSLPLPNQKDEQTMTSETPGADVAREQPMFNLPEDAEAALLWEVAEERKRAASKGYTPEHDREHGVAHVLGWAFDRALSEGAIQTAGMIQSAQELLIAVPQPEATEVSVERMAHFLSEWLDDQAPLHERRVYRTVAEDLMGKFAVTQRHEDKCRLHLSWSDPANRCTCRQPEGSTHD